MRSIDELIPDVAVAAAGAPPFVVRHALTRALAEFLSVSEAWREWSYAVDPEDIVSADGVFDWANFIDPADGDYADFGWLRTKRVETVLWGDESCELEFKTARQLAHIDREWRSRADTTPRFFTQEGDSGGSVRFVAIPNGTEYGDLEVVARLVVITNVSNGLGTGANSQIAKLPERLFERYRETIVAGALAILYAIPGRDWTQFGQVGYQREVFERGMYNAQSAAAADYGHPTNIMTYGGL